MGNCAGKRSQQVIYQKKLKNQTFSPETQVVKLQKFKSQEEIIRKMSEQQEIEEQQSLQLIERFLQKSPSKRIARRQFSFEEDEVQDLEQHPDTLVGKLNERDLQKSPSKLKISNTFTFDSEQRLLSLTNQPNIHGSLQFINSDTFSQIRKQSEDSQFAFAIQKVNQE